MATRIPYRRMAPLFWVLALAHAAAVVSRFDALVLPGEVTAAILLAQFPLLLLGGYFEGRLDYGEEMKELPLWMRIKSRAVKMAATFAAMYLVLVVLQTWDLSIGPIDPTPPDVWPLAQRAGWFLMFTFGMFFPFYLAAAGTLIPGLRLLTAPARLLPTLVAVPLLTAVGLGAGWGAVALVSSSEASGAAAAFQALRQRIEESPATMLAMTLAMVWVPILLGALLRRVRPRAATED